MQAATIGKYRIIAELGQGGMASVYLAVVPGPAGVNKLLVVKLLRKDLSGDSDFLAMFLDEARLAARLNHANVVQTYEVGFDGTSHFLAMDFLDGQPLHFVLRKASRSGMPLDLHVRILADTLAGLHYAHTLTDFDGTPLRVVHRDVSPQNVFVTYDGQVKLVDFGIAKAVGVSGNTQSGVFKGKLSYVAPEQAAGDPVDARADVFSVGVMLWEAIARRRFAQGEGQAAMLARRIAGNEPRIRQVVPDVAPELAGICDRAMAQRREDRYESAQEMRDALEGFLDRSSRRVGPREISGLVVELFDEERGQVRRVIDEQMRQLQRETASTLPMPTIEVFPGIHDPTPITTIESRAAAERALLALRSTGDRASAQVPATRSQGTLAAAHISQAPPPANATARGILIALVIVAMALLGALFIVLFVKPSPPPAVATTATAEAAGIKLSITFGPPGAVAKLDGVLLVTNPFVAEVPRDRTVHRVDVEGPGLRPETRMVSYDNDVVVAVTLEAEPKAAGPAPSGSVDAGLPPDTRKRPVRPKRPGREIDEEDPYKK